MKQILAYGIWRMAMSILALPFYKKVTIYHKVTLDRYFHSFYIKVPSARSDLGLLEETCHLLPHLTSCTASRFLRKTHCSAHKLYFSPQTKFDTKFVSTQIVQFSAKMFGTKMYNFCFRTEICPHN